MSENKPASPPWAAKTRDATKAASTPDAVNEAPEISSRPDAPAVEESAPKALETQDKAPANTGDHNEALATAANAAKGNIIQTEEPVVMVTVTVPKAYILRVDDHTTVPYKAGVQEMPLVHADHWWSKNNGVMKYEPK
jgi:hypothetical protein